MALEHVIGGYIPEKTVDEIHKNCGKQPVEVVPIAGRVIKTNIESCYDPNTGGIAKRQIEITARVVSDNFDLPSNEVYILTKYQYEKLIRGQE